MLQVIGPDVIYCDTDSIKFVRDHKGDFKRINEELRQLAEEAGAYADNQKGKRYFLGTWDPEYENEPGLKPMTRFKTLGAKKYLYERWERDKETGIEHKVIHSTIAGVKKERGKDFFNKKGFEAFQKGTIIENSGHLVAYRNNDQIHKIVVKGCEMTTASNLALVDDTYTLGITPKYLELLKYLMDNIIIYQKEGDF